MMAQLPSNYEFDSSSSLLGFIPRQEAEECLHKSENGTFLIRFSDSELGGVTVAWITGVCFDIHFARYLCSS